MQTKGEMKIRKVYDNHIDVWPYTIGPFSTQLSCPTLWRQQVPWLVLQCMFWSLVEEFWLWTWQHQFCYSVGDFLPNCTCPHLILSLDYGNDAPYICAFFIIASNLFLMFFITGFAFTFDITWQCIIRSNPGELWSSFFVDERKYSRFSKI